MTALTVRGIQVATGTLSTAEQLVTTTGGATAQHNTLVGTATGYGELYAQGNAGAWAGAGSIGSPSGNGWLFDVTTLEGQTIASGTWTYSLRSNLAAGTITADIHVRAYKRSSGGVYTQIGSDFLLSAQSFTTTLTTYTITGNSVPAMAFGVGDKLYIDVWCNVTSNTGTISTTNWKINQGNQSNGNGIVAQAEMVTPGYAATPGGHVLITDGMGGMFS